jgi:DNA-binding Lrp family transcriptional regulator
MRAYILIRTRAGELPAVVAQTRRVSGVREANMTFGPYDAVAIVEADDLNAIGRLVARDIQPIPGILETLTCLAIEL